MNPINQRYTNQWQCILKFIHPFDHKPMMIVVCGITINSFKKYTVALYFIDGEHFYPIPEESLRSEFDITVLVMVRKTKAVSYNPVTGQQLQAQSELLDKKAKE